MLSEKENEIIEVLKTIYDPEIPVNIYDLGLVYEVKVVDDNALITITLTAPNCPEAESLPSMIRYSIIEQVRDLKKVSVEITFEPPWTPEKMSTEARIALDML